MRRAAIFADAAPRAHASISPLILFFREMPPLRLSRRCRVDADMPLLFSMPLRAASVTQQRQCALVAHVTPRYLLSPMFCIRCCRRFYAAAIDALDDAAMTARRARASIR